MGADAEQGAVDQHLVENARGARVHAETLRAVHRLKSNLFKSCLLLSPQSRRASHAAWAVARIVHNGALAGTHAPAGGRSATQSGQSKCGGMRIACGA
jgi:hypothetical protein